MTRFLLLLLLLLPLATRADIIATYRVGNEGNLSIISYKNDDMIREDTVLAAFPDAVSYTLLADGRLYSVSQMFGQAKVIDLDALAAATPAPPSPDSAPPETSLTPTGRAIVIAGIAGQVHDYRFGNQTHEMVTSTDPRLLQVARAQHLLLQRRIARSNPELAAQAQKRFEADTAGGLLRTSGPFPMELVSLEEKSLPFSHYTLPRGATLMPIPAAMPAAAAPAADKPAATPAVPAPQVPAMPAPATPADPRQLIEQMQKSWGL